MKNFVELIPSETMRSYIKKIGHVFTDAEQATIIYNLGLPFSKRDELLLEIASETSDSILRSQIEDRIALDKREVKKLLEETRDVIFCVEGRFSRLDEEYGAGEYGYYATAELARQTAMQSGKPFTLKIERVFTEPVVLSAVQSLSTVGGVYFNEAGEIVNYWSTEENERFNSSGECRVYGMSFEDRYIDIPYPFVHGSRVYVVGDTEIFHVGGFRSKEEEAARMKEILKRTGVTSLQECLDYTDTALPLYVRTVQGEVEHGHVSPLFLEFAGYRNA